MLSLRAPLRAAPFDERPRPRLPELCVRARDAPDLDIRRLDVEWLPQLRALRWRLCVRRQLYVRVTDPKSTRAMVGPRTTERCRRVMRCRRRLGSRAERLVVRAILPAPELVNRKERGRRSRHHGARRGRRSAANEGSFAGHVRLGRTEIHGDLRRRRPVGSHVRLRGTNDGEDRPVRGRRTGQSGKRSISTGSRSRDHGEDYGRSSRPGRRWICPSSWSQIGAMPARGRDVTHDHARRERCHRS